MADVHSKTIRSFNMSMIKGKDTKPEMLVRKYLFSKGLRYRLHDKSMPGKPDMVFPGLGIVVFVHGCFWHGHKGCKYFVIPKTRTDWWLAKLKRNQFNDKKNISEIVKNGWRVITIWECELRTDFRETILQSLYNKMISI